MEATQRNWTTYFKQNAKRVLRVEPDSYRLTETETRRITQSIQQFQLGEASEGKLLRQKAARFAKSSADPAYVESIDCLIKEENRHSAYLGAFMRDQGIALTRRVWTDSIFRFLRNLANLEVSIRVLVTAEIIALLYYRCLAQATHSSVLTGICNRMLVEEEAHVRFQMLHIHKINVCRFPLFSAWMDIAHAVVFHAALLAVWRDHKPVLAVEFANFRKFRDAALDRFKTAMDQGEEDALQSLKGESK